MSFLPRAAASSRQTAPSRLGPQLTAVVFLPRGNDTATHASRCLAYCEARGYIVAGIVMADWAAAFGMLADGTAQTLVVARPDHIPMDAQPRIEIATKEAAAAAAGTHAGSATRRRPNRIG